MTRLAVALALVALLVLPSAAAAKGPLEEGSLLLCGPQGCRSIDDRGTLDGLSDTLWRDPAQGAGQPAAPAAYYELRFDGTPRELAAYFVPAADRLAVRPSVRLGVGWVETPQATAAGLEQLARGLAPFPAPRLVRVYLDPGRAADPAPYLALLGPLAKGAYPSATTARVTLDLVSAEPSPWTPRGAHALLTYAPEEHVILGDEAGWRRVPRELAALIERDAAAAPVEDAAPPSAPDVAAQPMAVPAPATSAGTDGFPWGLVATIAAGALVVLVLLAIRHRVGTPVPPLARGPR
jgi:hypothetical protein